VIHVASLDQHFGHRWRGGNRTWLQAVQRCSARRCSAAAAQNGRASALLYGT
jgi:hypothetical protein